MTQTIKTLIRVQIQMVFIKVDGTIVMDFLDLNVKLKKYQIPRIQDLLILTQIITILKNYLTNTVT